MLLVHCWAKCWYGKQYWGWRDSFFQDGKLHVTNSFALPFEEDLRDPQVWFVDHNYHEKMYAMFKKVSGSVGGYMFAFLSRVQELSH